MPPNALDLSDREMNDLFENQIRFFIPIIVLYIFSTEVEEKLQKISKRCHLLVI